MSSNTIPHARSITATTQLVRSSGKKKTSTKKASTGAVRLSANKTSGSGARVGVGAGAGAGAGGVVGAAATNSWSELCKLESEQRAVFSSKIQDKQSKAEAATKAKTTKDKAKGATKAGRKSTKAKAKAKVTAGGGDSETAGNNRALGALAELAHEEEVRRNEFRMRVTNNATVYSAAPSVPRERAEGPAP